MKVLVTHAFYGCETGCCGHVVSVDEKDGPFLHTHPRSQEDFRQWAERLVASEMGEEHVADLDWENSVVWDD